MIKNIVLKAIKLYQTLISPFLGQRCRFYPSCSEYAARVIEKHGVWPGCFKGLRRILKCHPLHPGGVDLP